MQQGKVFKAAAANDWQALKAIFEKAKPVYVPGTILESGDDLKIVLDEDPAKAIAATAIENIRRSSNFQNIAEWFASAFDNHLNGLATVARNIDAIFALADKIRKAQSVYYGLLADIEDRMDAQQEINSVASYSSIKLPDGTILSKKIFKQVTGLEVDSVPSLLNSAQYGDMKLTQFKDAAGKIAVAAGVDPVESIRRIQDINAEMIQAQADLNAKASPICEAYNNRLTDAEESSGYNTKKKDLCNIVDYYSQKRKEIGDAMPRNVDPYDSEEERQALIQKHTEWQKQLDDIFEERSIAVGKLQEEARLLFEKALEIAGDLNTELLPLNEAYNQFITQKRQELDEACSFASKLKDHVISNSPVSKETADQWFDDMVMIPKNMQTNLKKRGYTPEKLKEDMTEFHRLTGGRLTRITFDVKGGRRAAAQPITGVVYVAGAFDKRTLFHELAHVLEDDERTRTVANRFLDQRTGRATEGGNKVQRLSALTGNSNYKSDEVAYKDSFIDPYVGKYYRDGITEVFSMGMQYFNSPESMAVLYEKDPEHFNFMMGYMATLPRLDQAKVETQQKAMADQKESAVSSDEFLKALDKKIAKAGDFWTTEGFEIGGYGTRKYAMWPGTKEGSRSMSASVKGEKNIKRALWLHIAAGKPKDGPYSLWELTGRAFAPKGNIPKEIYQNQALIEGGLQ